MNQTSKKEIGLVPLLVLGQGKLEKTTRDIW